nr:hypothetical protein [Tanacetum cinerariifolium]
MGLLDLMGTILLSRTPNHRRGRCSSSSRHALRRGKELINGGLNLDNSATVAYLQNAIHHKKGFGRYVIGFWEYNDNGFWFAYCDDDGVGFCGCWEEWANDDVARDGNSN